MSDEVSLWRFFGGAAVHQPMRLPLGIVLICLAAASVAGAQPSWDAAGSFGLDLRWFPEDPASELQTSGTHSSATLEPELRWRSEGREHQFDFAVFARWDAVDSERSHLDVRESSYRWVGNSLELLVGVSRVFWGVTESRHLVDVINQVDAVEDIDEEDRLGQPMLRLAWQRRWGRLELYSLLGFRERTFPGERGRLRPPLPVDADRPLYQAREGNDHLDWALRFSHSLGSWDVGASYFHGTGREPQFVLAPSGEELQPLYVQTEQISLDVQSTLGAWLWKLEALVREGQGETFGAAVAGLERTLYQFAGTSADLGLLCELLRDERDATAPPTIYDDDTFLGVRLAFNDLQNSEVLLGAIVDNHDRSTVAVLEATRRFGARLVLSLDVRFFADVDRSGDLVAFADDSFATLRLSWHW